MGPLRRHVARLLKAGQTCGVPKTEAVCREIGKLYDALWTFVRVEGVEPTNNVAERHPSGRAVAQRELWDAKYRRVPFCRSPADGSRNAQATAPQCPRLSD